MKFDLTKFVLIILVILMGVLFGRQYFLKIRYQKAYSDKIEELNIKESELIEYHLAKYTQILDSLKELKSQLIAESKKRELISVQYQEEKEKIKTFTGDSLYALILQGRELIGAVFDVDSTHLSSTLLNKIELIECVEVKTSLETENVKLLRYVNSCVDNSRLLVNEIKDCYTTNTSLSKDLEKEVLKKKEFKRKMWTNRGIAGFFGVILIAIAL